MPTDTTLPDLSPAPIRRARTLPRLQEMGLIVVIIVLVTILSIYGWYDARPGQRNTFLNFDNLIDGIATPMSYYAIMAVGVTFVIITAGIDISIGSILALAALGTAAVLQMFPPDASAWVVLPIGIALPMAIGLAAGLVNGVCIVGMRMHPFIVTLATLSIFRGIANVSMPVGVATLPNMGILPRAFTTGFMRMEIGPLNFLGLEIAPVRIMPLVVMLVCVVAGWIFLRLLIAGRETYAVGGNEEAARFSGLPVKRVLLRVYALSGLAAGIAGMVSLGRFGTASTNTGTGYELTVIAAAVVGGASLSGGRGTALGALLGTLILALIENAIYILHLDQNYRLIIIGMAILVAVALDRFSEYLRNRRLAGTRA